MKIKIFSLVVISVIVLSFTIKTESGDEKNWNECVEKYNANWGEPCPDCTYNNDIFHVSFRNICEENVDVFVAVQESNKSWRCLYTENIAPKDTITAFACKGTGKYLYWVRKAGDREMELPTCDEVNIDYKE